MALNIGNVVVAWLADAIEKNKQFGIDFIVKYGDAGLTQLDATIKASDHIPIISSIINSTVDKLVMEEEAALPDQASRAIDALITLLKRDAGQSVPLPTTTASPAAAATQPLRDGGVAAAQPGAVEVGKRF